MERSIRLATPADAAQCAAIYAPHVRDSAVSFETDPPSADEVAQRIETTLQRFPWLVCVDGSEVIGYAYAGAHRQRVAFQWSVEVSVYVKDGHHRQGVGKALYTSLFACLRVLGYYNAYAVIALPNDASVALHESLGFRHVGTLTDVGYKMGKWHTVGYWELGLRDRSAPEPPVGVQEVSGTAAWSEAVASGEALLPGS